jgi:two-component SAPR family response regulator
MEQPIKCVIIDDEKPAVDLLEHYINKVDSLVLVCKFSHIDNRVKLLLKEAKVDAVFLDLSVKGSKEFFAESVDQYTCILTTAYPAAMLTDLKITHLLNKPILFEKFLKILNEIFVDVK